METQAVLGDGPHGTAGSDSGDFDFYSVDLTAGQTLTTKIELFDGLETLLVIYDAAGEIVAINDSGSTSGGTLTYTPTANGTYYVMVSDFGGGRLPADPFDSSSGFGNREEGNYKGTRPQRRKRSYQRHR